MRWAPRSKSPPLRLNARPRLCLKVAVEDAQKEELPLKDLDELSCGDDMRLARSVGLFS